MNSQQGAHGTADGVPASVLELFGRQVARRPDAIALRCRHRSLSYCDLDRQSSSVAYRLRECGVGPDVLVAMSIERSLELVIGLLGILKAGGACVPLDGAYPVARLTYMIDDSRARVLLTTTSSAGRIPFAGVELVLLDRVPAYDDDLAARDGGGKDLAYVLYTSGSTGVPKGAAMEHGPLARLIDWQLGSDRGASEASTAQFAPISFDVAFQEILSTLCGGGTLVMMSDEDRRDPTKLLRFLAAESIERLFLPTAALHPLAELARGAPSASLRNIYVAGEQLKITPAIREWLSAMPRCALHNHYGPTESHVATSFTLAGDPDRWPAIPPIGTPLPHVVVQILDRDRHPVPPGEIGEVYIGGACLARGYVNRPDLTAERFIGIPDAGRWYHTGDLGRERNGCLEYCGRVDRQVKIRGYRVELGEIEVELLRDPDVAECVVAVDEDVMGNNRLVAYVVPRAAPLHSPGGVAISTPVAARREFAPVWRDALRQRLPDFMVPAAWMIVPGLPMTPSGKVDRAALPPVGLQGPLSEAVALSPNERTLASIVAQLLGVERVGRDDDFFAIGGHSLLATRVIARVGDAFNVDLSLRSFFDAPSVAGLAALVANAPRRAPAQAPGFAFGPDMDALSEAELDALLRVEFGRAQRSGNAAD